jgi:hypothetical protein
VLFVSIVVSMEINRRHCFRSDPHINLFRSSCKMPAISCPILTKFGVSRQFFIKVSNFKLHTNPSIGSRAVTCEKTDRHGEANRRFPQFMRTRLKRKSLKLHNVAV